MIRILLQLGSNLGQGLEAPIVPGRVCKRPCHREARRSGPWRSSWIAFAFVGLTGLRAQSLPPPVAAGKVTLEITGDNFAATYAYQPPALSDYYTIKAEKLGVARAAGIKTTRADVTIPAVPPAAGETTISYSFDANYETTYLAAHPGIGLIKPAGGWGPGWSAVVPYSQITLKTIWDANGQATFELNAVPVDASPARFIQGLGWGAMFSQYSSPTNLPVTIAASKVTQASSGIGWFRWYPPSVQYRFLEGTAYYFTQLQADGTTTVHHISSYRVPVGDIREFYPIGEVKVTGTPGHEGSPEWQSSSDSSVPEVLKSGDTYDKLKARSDAQAFSDDKFADTTAPTADYAFATAAASASKLRYKLVIQSGLARLITWAETFTPADQTEPTDYVFLSENVTATATETLPHIIDPFDTGNVHRHGSVPGQYRILTFDSALSADTNHDGGIMSPSGPITGPRVAAADTGALGADLSFRPNQNNDVDPGDPANTANGLDFENDRVDGVDDLSSFVPVYLDIGQLLKQLPPASGFTYKLKQADEALNFVYTNLTQVTAFFFLTNPATGFGPDLTQPASSAPTTRITTGGVDIFGGATGSDAFRALAVLNQGAVILIEARQATAQPLVLEVSRGGTVVAEVQLALATTEIRVNEISFDGEKYWQLTSDDASTIYSAPQWKDDNGDANASDTGENNYAVAYTRKTTPKIGAKFMVSNAGALGAIKIKATGPDGMEISETTATVAGNEVSIALTAVSGALPDMIKFYDRKDDAKAFKLEWKLKIGSADWIEIGTTKHTVYVTLADPLTPASDRQLTLFDTACRESDGLSIEGEVVSKVYAAFTHVDGDGVPNMQRINPTTSQPDGVAMTYWSTTNPARQPLCWTTAGLLSIGDGRCGAWATFFHDALLVNGIHSSIITVNPPQNEVDRTLLPVALLKLKEDIDSHHLPGGDYEVTPIFYVKNWDLSVYSSDPFNPVRKSGAAGQGNPDPRADFDNHAIVAYNGSFYDPSYAAPVFSTDINWEDGSLDGFGAYVRKVSDGAFYKWIWKLDQKGSKQTTFLYD